MLHEKYFNIKSMIRITNYVNITLVNKQFNDNNNEGQKVNIIKGKSNFIIPNQFDTLKYQTNAYNIDWNRIINPMTTF